MKLEEQVCSFEPSKRLEALGVKQDSLFSWVVISKEEPPWYDGPFLRLTCATKNYPAADKTISAFTVAELGEKLPHDIKTDSLFTGGKTDWRLWSWFNGEHWLIYYKAHWESQGGNEHYMSPDGNFKTEANARAEMLIHLLEKGMVKP